MVATWTERRSRAAGAARGTAIFAVVLAVVAAVAHRLDLLETEPFLGSLSVVLALVLVAALLWLRGFATMWGRGDRVGSDLIVAALVLSVILLPLGWMGFRGLTTPMISDVATDTATPPTLMASGRITPWRNAIAPIDAEAAAAIARSYPALLPHRYTLDAPRLRQLISDLVEARGWSVSRPFGQVPFGGVSTLNAVAGSFLLGFPSDIAIRVVDDGEESLVDMRSASQFGGHDFGDNAMRIQRFFVDLDAGVTAATSTGTRPDEPSSPDMVLPERGPVLED